MNFTIDLFFAKQDLSLYLAVSNQTTGRERETNFIERKEVYSDLVNIDLVADEARNNLLVLKTDKPSPTSDMNTAALNDKRSLFIDEFDKSYF